MIYLKILLIVGLINNACSNEGHLKNRIDHSNALQNNDENFGVFGGISIQRSNGKPFKLKSIFGGDDLCLESNKGTDMESKGGAILVPCIDSAGQEWFVENKNNDKYFKLKSKLGGNELCLESNRGLNSQAVLGGASFMAACSPGSGQEWYIDELGTDKFSLKSMFGGGNLCLESNGGANPASTLNGQSLMQPCSNSSGQTWYIEKVITDSNPIIVVKTPIVFSEKKKTKVNKKVINPEVSTEFSEDLSEGLPASNPTGYDGLHGYIGYDIAPPPPNYDAGVGFYSAVWPLVSKPFANFQIGLPGAWIMPNNNDNLNTPLCPNGTLARDNWDERAPTYKEVFQSIEGGLGYWAGNQFRYGPPKFSLNGTPQCYDYEIGSPGWSFFRSQKPLPDNRLGIAQLSNRLLVPPDGLPFIGNPNGKYFGYSWMALPLTKPELGPQMPTGSNNWTVFVNSSNFKGPIAYFIPETWSKIGKLFNHSFAFGRGLDSRFAVSGGGAMEINTVPFFSAEDKNGISYSKIPQLNFPVDENKRTILVQDYYMYSKETIYNDVELWRDGGPPVSGNFSKGTWRAPLRTNSVSYKQDGNPIQGINESISPSVFDSFFWGLDWSGNSIEADGKFPQYFRKEGNILRAISGSEVPSETELISKNFPLSKTGSSYDGGLSSAWSVPGSVSQDYTVTLVDGTKVTYRWYRFVDQPSFQQYGFSLEKKNSLQSIVEKIHANWPIDGTYMAPPTNGSLATLDPALIVTPPEGMSVGFVPIVIRQEKK